MPNTLLVVDGRSHPRLLTERLHALGYECLYARGPLRAHALLSQHTVDLILWKDNTGNAELSAELLEEWERHPRIPVVRLFIPGAVTPEGIAPDRFARAVAANLPADGPEYPLFTTLSRILTGGLVADDERPSNELAFRHVVTSLRGQPATSTTTESGRLPGNAGPETSLNTTERELLRTSAGKVVRPLRWMFGRWLGGNRTRTA